MKQTELREMIKYMEKHGEIPSCVEGGGLCNWITEVFGDHNSITSDIFRLFNPDAHDVEELLCKEYNISYWGSQVKGQVYTHKMGYGASGFRKTIIAFMIVILEDKDTQIWINNL